MVFSSIVFLFYFLPVFLACYYLIPKKFKNPFILAGSILFYAWGAPRFIFVILGTTFIDFHLVRLMDAMQTVKKRRLLLCLSLFINIGLLFYFKYCNFFIENVNHLLSLAGWKEVGWVKLALPIGISFYTFESVTYVVDVYRRIHKPLKHFWDYQLYIILFPKLIAGPIIRFHDIADQLYDHVNRESYELRLRGFYRFVLGLSKKVMIANVMGAHADTIFAIPAASLDTVTAWCGALSYTFQIYFDFSGYSDMAIGLGMMMGFRFPENFNNPYTATSITDFWRRWHITLGAWMREYLYIPLGGNRVGSDWKLYRNLWIVFLASGLWHGAAWGFVFWGAYHGFFLVAERMFLNRWLKKARLPAVAYSFVVVMTGWVFFRLEDLSLGWQYVQRMFVLYRNPPQWFPDTEFIVFALLASVFSFFTLVPAGKRLHDRIFYSDYPLNAHFAMAGTVLVLLVIAAGRITVGNFNPFIYFRF